MQIDCGDFFLRPLRMSDKESLTRNANNRKIWCTVRDRFPHPYTLQDAEEFLRPREQALPVTDFCIEYKQECIGCIGIIPQTDVYRRSAEIGYWLGEPFWGKGIATRAVQQLSAHVFQQSDVIRLYACIFAGNTASGRVLEKAGFRLEGIGRNAVFKDGQVLDEHRYALLKEL